MSYIEDPSNKDTAHDRNFVRHTMMPHIKHLNPGIETTVRKMILEQYNKTALCP